MLIGLDCVPPALAFERGSSLMPNLSRPEGARRVGAAALDHAADHGAGLDQHGERSRPG